MEKTVEEHIKDLKREFAWILFPTAIIFIATFIFSTSIINYLISWIGITESVVSITPFESLNTSLTMSGMITLVLIMPLTLYSLYRFSKPALTDKVIKTTRYYLFGSIFIALFGMLFGVFIFSKLVLSTLINNYQIANPMWSIQSIMTFVIVSGLSMALVMQVIILLPALNNMDLLNPKYLKERRGIIAIAILIASAIITPPDILSQVFMFVPFYGSFELGLLLCRKEVNEKCLD